MKETIKLILILTIICAVSASLLAMVYKKTIGPITAARQAKTIKAAGEVMPAGAPQAVKELIGDETFFVSRDADGTVQAVAVQGSANGYAGKVTLLVGISADKMMVTYRVIESKESAGFGTKIAEPLFMTPLMGKPISSKWMPKKDGGDFDAITGATISSRAAFACIRDAISKYEKAASKINSGG